MSKAQAEPAIEPLPRTDVNLWYAGLTLALLGAMYLLSSTNSELIDDDRLPPAVWNLAHVPLFAVLAMCWVKTAAGNREPSLATIGAGFVGATLCAFLDEWHQSFVPGRHASWSDLLLDIAGIGGILLAVYRRQLLGHGRPVGHRITGDA